jgi:N-acetylglucosamine kinase-like BadF-type ATPase
VKRHFGKTTVEEVTLGLHFGDISATELRNLAPKVFAAAAEGDDVAGSLVDRMGDEVVAMSLVALRRLDLLDTPTEIVLAGGVLRGRDPRMMARIEAGLAAGGATPEIVVVAAPPIVGAALLGLDHLGIVDADVQSRVRDAFSTKALAGTP